MRLPPVYMMDALLVHNMGVTLDTGVSAVTPLAADVNITEHITNSTDLYQTFSTLYGGNPALLIIPHILRGAWSLTTPHNNDQLSTGFLVASSSMSSPC